MEFGNLPIVRIVKRLSEAVGYLELGMTGLAMASLDGLKELGPFAPVAEMLRAEAARQEHRFEDAASSLATAAQMLPSPGDRRLWQAVSAWHHQAGNTDLAIETLGYARGALPPKAKPKAE